jgi:hypothetical protein
MTTRTLHGFIARETDKAVAFIAASADRINAKPLWLPRKKIAVMAELDLASQAIQLEGESIARQATPVEIQADAEFLDKIGA